MFFARNRLKLASRLLFFAFDGQTDEKKITDDYSTERILYKPLPSVLRYHRIMSYCEVLVFHFIDV